LGYESEYVREHIPNPSRIRVNPDLPERILRS
jgi:hypothetical protein